MNQVATIFNHESGVPAIDYEVHCGGYNTFTTLGQASPMGTRPDNSTAVFQSIV